MRETDHRQLKVKYRSNSFSNKRVDNMDKLSHWEELQELFNIFCKKYLEILENYQRSGDFWAMTRDRQENQRGDGIACFYRPEVRKL